MTATSFIEICILNLDTPPPLENIRKQCSKIHENARKTYEKYEKNQKQENLIWSSGQMQSKSSSNENKFEMQKFLSKSLAYDTNLFENVRKTMLIRNTLKNTTSHRIIS